MYRSLYWKVQESTGNKKMPQQLTMSFEPIGHEQWENLRDYMDDRVIPDFCRENNVLKKYVAADLEMSPSDLRRKLVSGDDDPRNFSTDDLERWLEKTQNLKPLLFLFERYGNLSQQRIRELEKELEAERSKQRIGTIARPA